MSRFTSYYLYQKYEKVGDGEWTPTYPNEYSISGDSENTMPLVIKSENDANCGYSDPIYRWADTEDTICIEAQAKFSATYSDGTTYIIPCASSDTLTSQEIKAHTTPYSSMTSAVIGNCVTTLGENAFQGCDSLSSVVIPSSLQRVYVSGFDVPRISDVYIEDLSSWCNVWVSAFWVSNPFYSSRNNVSQKIYINGVSVSSLTIPNDVININYGVFAGCNALKSLTIPNNVKIIGSNSFRACPNLSSITLNEGIEVIDIDAFFSTPLTSITIPNSVTTIRGGAFANCEKVKSITIGSGLTSITTESNGNPFDVSAWNENPIRYRVLSSITVSPDNTHFEVVNNCLVEISTKRLVVGYNNAVIPNDIIEIESKAFYKVSGLTSIQLPSTLAKIGISAFGYCGNLTSITIPSSVTEIGGWAFFGCNRINSATILATTPPTLGLSVFTQTSSTYNYPIYVPAQSVEAYKTATNWSEYASRIQAIP